MKFARYVFLVAGVLGILSVVPQYFLIDKHGADMPPAITHAEYYYGFTGVAIAFQFVFLIISSDPVKYRLLMLPSILEKLGWVIPVFTLYAQGRVSSDIFAAGILDSVYAVLFAISYLKVRRLS